MAKSNENTEAQSTEDILATLQVAVDESETNFEAVNTATTEAKDAAKEAAKNLKAAKAYARSVGDDGGEAQKTVDGWSAEVERTAGVLETQKEALKEARKARADAKRALKNGAPAKVREKGVEQNGQVRPHADSKSGKLWAIFDEATAERGSPCAIADVMEQCLGHDMTEGSCRSSYSHWRRFNGVEKGRIASIHAPAMDVAKLAEAKEKVAAQLIKARARVETLEAKQAVLDTTPVADDTQVAEADAA